jgi:hypothetical protein
MPSAIFSAHRSRVEVKAPHVSQPDWFFLGPNARVSQVAENKCELGHMIGAIIFFLREPFGGPGAGSPARDAVCILRL